MNTNPFPVHFTLLLMQPFVDSFSEKNRLFSLTNVHCLDVRRVSMFLLWITYSQISTLDATASTISWTGHELPSFFFV